MRVLVQVVLCGLVVVGTAPAQRGGVGGGGVRGGMGGGGMRGGMGGGGFRGGGGFGGGFRGGNNGFGGFRGGVGGFGGFRGGVVGVRGFRGYGGYGGYYSGYWPYYGYPAWGFGFGGYWPGYSYGDYWDYPYASSYPGYSYPAYYSTPSVSVVYPPQQTASAPVYVERANPVMHEYDQYGQEIGPGASGVASSPIYLIAFKDGVIRAAASYWVDGSTLHYVTLQHEEKQVAMDTIDRDLSLQLNRERRVPFQLPR